MDVVALGKILSRQGRAEVVVMLANDGDHAFAESIAVAPVARLAALAGDKACSALGVQSAQQSEYLSSAQLQQRRRILDPQLSPLDT